MDASFPDGMIPCIEKFFESEDTRAPGLDLYYDVFDTELFFPLQRKDETRVMIQAARSVNPRVVMEIGADKGGGLYHWCKSLPTVKQVIACEIRGAPYKHLFERHFPDIEFLWAEKGSTEVLRTGPVIEVRTQDVVAQWLQERDAKIDVLFIDGCKLSMESDFDAYLPLMRKGGVVFIHDVQDREPRAAFERVKARGYRTRTVVLTGEATEALDREERGYPPKNPHEAWLRHWRGRSCGLGVIYLPND